MVLVQVLMVLLMVQVMKLVAAVLVAVLVLRLGCLLRGPRGTCARSWLSVSRYHLCERSPQNRYFGLRTDMYNMHGLE